MRLYLVRHAQTAWNAEMRVQGHQDEPLDQEGRRQAARLAEAFRDIELDSIVSSDLKRAASTAEPLAELKGIPVRLDPRLRERAFGVLEGRLFEEFRQHLDALVEAEGVDPMRAAPEGGESLVEVWNRLAGVADELYMSEGTKMVISHGGTCGLLMARLVRGSLDTARAFRFGNTSVNELVLRPERVFQLVRYNDLSHLVGDRALSGSVDGAAR